MIAALICGREEKTGSFPGRNIFPLIGRPLMSYPILAAHQAKLVDRTFLSTDSEAMASIGAQLGVEVIMRPDELCVTRRPIHQVIKHGLEHITGVLGELEALVVLLCNAPTVTAEMIDNGITQLREHPSADAVASASQHNEYNPLRAKCIDATGSIKPVVLELTAAAAENLDSLGSVFFIDSLLWIIEPESFSEALAADDKTAYSWLGKNILPLINTRGVDIDYEWQIPMAEYLLRQAGFTTTQTPYQQEPSLPPASSVFPVVEQNDCRVLITTIPFGAIDRKPLNLLEEHNVEYVINPIGRKLMADEVVELAKEFDIIIAGTEPITRAAIEGAPRLKLISRVGIGLDSVDLIAARENDVMVSYTPDAPSPAVAELTVGMMLSLLRMTNRTDRAMRQGVWHRWMGRRLQNVTVGIVGVGRVGKLVTEYLSSFGCSIIANDLDPDLAFGKRYEIQWVSKDTLFRDADVVTIHVPKTRDSENMVGLAVLEHMKDDALLINTSRGGIVNENDLVKALEHGSIGAAGVDVYEHEPYSGPLVAVDNCLLTCHMGSCSTDCRLRMELEATEEAVRFYLAQPLNMTVPEQEYQLQKRMG